MSQNKTPKLNPLKEKIEIISKEDKVYYKYSTVYEIQPGDTLTSIAKNHLEGYESINEYVDEVKFMNQLCSSDSLVAGNKIFIPYCSTEIK